MTLMVGFEAPNFSAPAVMPDGTFDSSFDFKAYLDGQIGILFFYMMNFSYVCPLELAALHNRTAEFAKRGAKVVAVSCDTQMSHIQLRRLSKEQGGMPQLAFPLVADNSHVVAKGYNVLLQDSVAIRATFVIDNASVVRMIQMNDTPFPRNADEILRFLDVMDHYKNTGNICYPGWRPGVDGIQAKSETVFAFLAKYGDKL